MLNEDVGQDIGDFIKASGAPVSMILFLNNAVQRVLWIFLIEWKTANLPLLSTSSRLVEPVIDCLPVQEASNMIFSESLIHSNQGPSENTKLIMEYDVLRKAWFLKSNGLPFKFQLFH